MNTTEKKNNEQKRKGGVLYTDSWGRECDSSPLSSSDYRRREKLLSMISERGKGKNSKKQKDESILEIKTYEDCVARNRCLSDGEKIKCKQERIFAK
jgi:hypothetical protein